MNREEWLEARPLIELGLAFIIWVSRYENYTPEQCTVAAQIWTTMLEQRMKFND